MVHQPWKYNFLQVVEAIVSFLEREERMHEVVWFDVFSNSQHDTGTKPFEWWCGTFMNAVGSMGNVLMIILPWSNPIALTRAWCIFEVYATCRTNSRFEVSMCREENERFLKDIKSDVSKYYKMLATVNSSKAEAWKPEDRDAIFDAIRREVGFAEMDSMVLRCMESWMTRDLTRELSRHVTAGDEESVGVWHNALGLFFQFGKMLPEAATHLEAALRAFTRYKGAEHTETLMCMHSLARVYQYQGRLAEAEQLYQTSLDARRRTLGAEHQATLASTVNLGHLYRNQGRFAEAEPLFLTCFEARKRTLGDDHADTTWSRMALACLYADTARHAEALPLLQDALDRRTRRLGSDHRNTLASAHFLGCCLRDLGRPGEAAVVLFDCYEAARRVLGPGHTDSLKFRASLDGVRDSNAKRPPVEEDREAGDKKAEVAEKEGVTAVSDKVYFPV